MGPFDNLALFALTLGGVVLGIAPGGEVPPRPIAIDPAAISARPASTTICEEATAPESPAARAKGTVSPSDSPMTMSRTVSLDWKCPSM